MYNITTFDIQEAIKQLNSAMTIKGQIIGYAIAKCGKNIENRSRKIKDGWYALHVGGSKNVTHKHLSIYSLIDQYDPKDLPPRKSIIGCFKIEGYVTKSDNPWFCGPIGSNIVKYIHFENPIQNIPGHQSITYSLDTIEKKLYKKNTSEGKPQVPLGKSNIRIRAKIIQELKRLIKD